MNLLKNYFRREQNQENEEVFNQFEHDLENPQFDNHLFEYAPNNSHPVINIRAIPSVRRKFLQRPVTTDTDNYLNNFKCAICQNEIGEESFVTDLPHCHHLYHFECLSDWFAINSTCPICKRDYLPEFRGFVEE